MGLQSQFFFMPSNTISGFQPHQDDYYVRSEDFNGFVSCWIALTNVNKKMVVLRYGHRVIIKVFLKLKPLKMNQNLIPIKMVQKFLL